MFGVQLEFEKNNEIYTGRYTGFKVMDEGILAILLSFAEQKISELNYITEIHKQSEEYVKTFDYINKMLEYKTIAQLSSFLRATLPGQLGYEYGEILFYSEERNLYFNI